ncbi:MAG TPA: flagellar type III secretion system pore protein FliP [Chthonomonadaceae bacterium]|nr:flagellar type III secretion system pore protein FliP [Chthonomonadaceae bacterium]
MQFPATIAAHLRRIASGTSGPQPITSYQQPATSYHLPAAGGRQPETRNLQPAASHQLPAAGRRQPETSNQQPGTSYQQPATGYQLLRRPVAILKALLTSRAFWIGILGMLLSGWLTALQAHAQTVPLPKITLGVDQAKNPQDVAISLQILLMMTILTIAPSLLIMMTAFTRLIIVFSILRSALGTPQLPPNQILAGMALFLTFFIMQPTFTKINDDALQPYFANKITMPVMLDRAEKPLHGFMLRQTYKSDLIFFINLSKVERPRTEKDVQLLTLIPAFITSELKTAFIIGFYIYLPFLVIDMVVASTLMSMGMMMLPPTVISLPAKLMLFVLANGWTLLIGSLAHGFR